MDFLADVGPLLTSIGVAAIPVVGAVVSGQVVRVLHARNVDTMWFEVVSRAGGLAYQHLVQSGRPMDKAALTNAAAVGAGYILERMPGVTKERDLQSHDLIDIAQAELGKLLAQDPTVGPALPNPPLFPEDTTHG